MAAAPEPAVLLQEILGYLNFSAGAEDARFLANLNDVYAWLERDGREQPDTHERLRLQLDRRLVELKRESAAFRESSQAQAVLALVFDQFLSAYREFHRDLLFHQPDTALWRPFFLGRVFEAVLAQESPWEEHDRIIPAAIRELNDFIGYRPVAVLHNNQRMEPHAHEWVRPAPLYIRGAGVAVGRYRAVVERALAILRETPERILRAAQFDPQLLDELAFDPRAYDFDHPANKRPNYHFGMWDPHRVDGQGRYRRFIVQQISLDGLLQRIETDKELPPDELLGEAAAVLAGTILMASGTCGSGPGAYDSSMSLGKLAPHIAAYRDEFYRLLLAKMENPHGERLRAEVARLKQPFAAARQHLNQVLTRRRAAQLEHVQLALLFARMGYPAAAMRQIQIVPVAAARLSAELQCRVTAGHILIESGKLADAESLLRELDEILQRSIECGAMVDPWNILGFQGNFSLYPSPENSVHDHRIEQLQQVLEQMFTLQSRLWSEAVAQRQPAIAAAVSTAMRELSRWWDQFAPTSVEGLDLPSGAATYRAARNVARAMSAWKEAGEAAGAIGFWRQHVEHFETPKAYVQVIHALLKKRDLVAAMALLVQWLGRAKELSLAQGDYTFQQAAKSWLIAATRGQAGPQDEPPAARVAKFFDYLEANADEFWEVPELSMPIGAREEGGQPDDIVSAAYEDVVYQDTTGDGRDADMLDAASATTGYELEFEVKRLRERLGFLETLAELWRIAAWQLPRDEASLAERAAAWRARAAENATALGGLLAAIASQKVQATSASRDALLEFERRRNTKDALLERVIAASVSMLWTECSLPRAHESITAAGPLEQLWQLLLAGDRDAVRSAWPAAADALRERTLLYVSLGRGGDPRRIVAARVTQRWLNELARWLPRLGLVHETLQLVAVAREMEAAHPVGAGAVSEFDRLFHSTVQSLVESALAMSNHWTQDPSRSAKLRADGDLVDCLEQLTEILLRQWLAHSRTLRLSALEQITDDDAWQELLAFIKRYGSELFTQVFLQFDNLRAILHQGVGQWVAGLREHDSGEETLQFVLDFDHTLPAAKASRMLEVILEAIVENYSEYRDYNTTTTQSDRGEMLHSLLDFLRLRVQYDRIAWNLRPVMQIHELLVRHGRQSAAELWRRSLAARTREYADRLEQRIIQLQMVHGMRLATVSDRLAERFVRPLTLDRIRALVQPAMQDARLGRASSDFDLLEQETGELAQEPTGAGLETPPWLEALSDEVDEVRRQFDVGAQAEGLPIPQTILPLDKFLSELARQ